MTTHLVTFSDESMSRSRELCVDSAMSHGVDGITWAYAATDADKRAGRGLGFWAWKPRIILDFLTDTTGGLAHPEDGDIVIYSDAGVEFIAPVSHIIERMDQDIFLFGNMYSHLHWCKADALNAIVPDIPWSQFNKQCQASVIFFRVSEWSRRFVKEWLDWCLTPGLIDDSPSVAANHGEFREHRHDQALLTCLAYTYDLPLHWWPAVYNLFSGPVFTYEKGEYVDTYPPLFHHHRLRDSEWPTTTQPGLAIPA